MNKLKYEDRLLLREYLQKKGYDYKDSTGA